MRLISDEFEDGGQLPTRCSADGAGEFPQLAVVEIPDAAVCLALTCHDPDVPRDRRPDGNFDHWVAWNIPPTTLHFTADGPDRGDLGVNTRGTHEWVPASPPPGSGPHRYIFTVYALDSMLQLPDTTTRAELEAAMDGHVVDSATLTSVYERG